jgi:DNA-binding MarR family transcriptional regulator
MGRMAGHGASEGAGAAPALVQVEQELRLTLRRAASASAELARRIHPDLDASAYPLLALIDAEPGVRATELAQRFGIGRATISRQLSRLHDLELISRTTDPKDSRGQLLTITPAGAERLGAARAARLDYLADVFSAWPEDDVRLFASLLARYSESAEAERPSHA